MKNVQGPCIADLMASDFDRPFASVHYNPVIRRVQPRGFPVRLRICYHAAPVGLSHQVPSELCGCLSALDWVTTFTGWWKTAR